MSFLFVLRPLFYQYNNRRKMRHSSTNMELRSRTIHLNDPISLKSDVRSDICLPTMYPIRNRREKDVYLKGVFPAGFSVNRFYADETDPVAKIKSKKHELVSRKETSAQNSILSLQSPNETKLNPPSYISWTRGDYGSFTDSTDDCKDDSLMDVAGPYFRERSRGADSNMILSKIELPLTITSPKSDVPNIDDAGDKNIASPIRSKDRIYLSTSVLPVMLPSHSTIRCSSIKNAASTTKINGGSYFLDNFSVPPVQTTLGSTVRSYSGSPKSPEAMIPRVLPSRIDIEFIRFRDFMPVMSTQSDTVHRHTLNIPSDASLKFIRNYVLSTLQKDEIKDAERDESRIAAGAKSALHTDRQDVELRYYHPTVKTWRLIQSPVEWLFAKQGAMERVESLKILYAIRKEEEIVEALRRSKGSRRNSQSNDVVEAKDRGTMSYMLDRPRLPNGEVPDTWGFQSSAGFSRAPDQTEQRQRMTPVTPSHHEFEVRPPRRNPRIFIGSLYPPSVTSATVGRGRGEANNTSPISLEKQIEFSRILEQRLMIGTLW